MERPRLRTDLEERRSPTGDLVGFRDPLFDRMIDLGPIALKLLTRLAEPLSTPELVAEVTRELGVPRPLVEASYRSFLLLNLLEGAGARIIERTKQTLAGSFDLTFLDGARFQCQGSGACCRGYAFGPLTPADRARLDELDLEGAGLGRAPHYEKRGEDWFLRTTPDGRCAFLQADERCGVHARFGAKAKPGLCQIYPMRALATIEGLKVYDGGECASFATSVRSGETLASDRERLRELLGLPVIQHPIVFLDEALPADMGHLLALQEAAAVRLVKPARAGEALLDVTRFLRRSVAALASCALELDGPEAALRDPPPLAPVVGASADALVRVVDDLHAAFLKQTQTPGAVDGAFLGILTVARHVAVSLADPTIVLVPDHAAIERVVASGPDFDEPLRLSLRSVVWGDQLIIERRLLPGIARLATSTFLIAVGAKLHARAASSDRVRAADLSFAQSTVLRMLRRPPSSPVFLQHEPRAWLLAEATGAWLGHEEV